jgi:two-component system chemotaxis sensor kinase CheA
MDDFEKELKVGFLEEAVQLIASTEQCFLSLEKHSQDQSVIEQIFRLAHNLKGSAGAVGFSEVAEFTHKFESLILKFKKKELLIDSNGVNLLLRCNDHLREMIEGLQANMGATFDSQGLIAEILAMIEGQSAPSAEIPSEQEAVFVDAQTAADLQQIENTALESKASIGFSPISQEELEIAMMPKKEEQFISEKDFQSPIEEIARAAAPVETKPEISPPQPVESSPIKKPQAQGPGVVDESIRVSLSKLDTLINYVGEMVILQTVLSQNRHLFQSSLLQKTVGQLSKISKNIQEISMGLRMIPIKATFQKMHRIVRDTSQKLDKEVDLHLVGEETELDKTVLEQMGDPLVHLVRNAVDHGLESTETRLALGKPATGNVFLRAYHSGGRLIIEVGEDGGGIDGEKLRLKAIEKGVIPASKVLTEKEKVELIFAPGFSTKSEVTDISGRGVGMDVVRTNIRALEGEIEIDTTIGKGTTFRISLPLTLAIIDGMIVRLANEKLIIPLTHVHESLRPQDKDITNVQNMGQVLTLRGESMPLYSIGTLMGSRLGKPKTEISEMTAIVIRVTGEPFAILVDEIIGQQQVVVKRLGAEFPDVKGISGTAILGDGKASLILDLPELSKSNSKSTKSHSSPGTSLKGVA